MGERLGRGFMERRVFGSIQPKMVVLKDTTAILDCAHIF
jgi:hypothetical protein